MNMNDKPSDLLGQVVDNRYLIDEILGQGGMGCVYKATQIGLERTVALKMIHPYMATDEVKSRFNREARSMTQLTHPGAVTVFDFGDWDERLYLVMEFVSGMPLSTLLRNEFPLTTERVVNLFKQLADALDAAHAANLVHRDLKPDNIIVYRDRDGEKLKVIDFGLAILVDDVGVTQVTRAGTIMGTPHYMSPEQIMSKPVDGRSDIYSVGVIVYQMLAGCLPFVGESEIEILMQHVNEMPKLPSVARPDLKIPQELESLVMWMMAKEPDFRPATMAVVGQHLDEAWRKLRGEAAPDGVRVVTGLDRAARQQALGIRDTSRGKRDDNVQGDLGLFVVAPTAAHAESVNALLTEGGYTITVMGDLASVMANIGPPGSGVVVIDLRNFEESVLDVLAGQLVGGQLGGLPVILIGSSSSMTMMTRSLELGVADYVPDTKIATNLAKAVRRAMRKLARTT